MSEGSYFWTRTAVDFKAASWTKGSDTGELSLRSIFKRDRRFSSKVFNATEQTEANFWIYELKKK